MLIDPFTLVSWEEARVFCQELNSDLVQLNDDDAFLGLLEYIGENSELFHLSSLQFS